MVGGKSQMPAGSQRGHPCRRWILGIQGRYLCWVHGKRAKQSTYINRLCAWLSATGRAGGHSACTPSRSSKPAGRGPCPAEGVALSQQDQPLPQFPSSRWPLLPVEHDTSRELEGAVGKD